MGDRKDTFHYTYSARQQEEIRNIRKKYLPQEPKDGAVAASGSERGQKRHACLPYCGYCRLPVVGGGDVLHHGLDGPAFYPGHYYWNCWDYCCNNFLSSLYAYYAERTGKDSAADFKADGRAFEVVVTWPAGRQGHPAVSEPSRSDKNKSRRGFIEEDILQCQNTT